LLETFAMAKADPFHLVGTTVAGRYAVEEVIGEGGFSVVYRAMHLVWKRAVAIKAFKGNTSLQPHDRERLLEGFFQEGALLAELSEHTTAVCQARDTSTLETSAGEWVPYIVLEWLDGETLEDVLRKERARKVAPRSIADAMRLLEPVVEALDFAHGRNIAHRDLKPANLFVLGDARGTDCVVKILDFGIANVLEDARKSLNGSTIEGAVFTPRYGAPEQFSRTFGPTGPWTDVFAIALILVELITGKPPLRGETIAQLGRNATSRRRRPTPRTHGVLVSDGVEKVFATALAVEPFDRYLSAADVWKALRVALPDARPRVESHGARRDARHDARDDARHDDALTSIAPPSFVPQQAELLATRLSFSVPCEPIAPPPLLRLRARRPEDRRRLAIGAVLLSIGGLLGGLLGVLAPRLSPIAPRVLGGEPPARAAVATPSCPSGAVRVEAAPASVPSASTPSASARSASTRKR
jgi:eukaryotic-like serine/threonine-protein kinase